MTMIIIRENLILLFGIFMILFAFSLGLHHNPIIAGISSTKYPFSMFTILKHPLAAMKLAKEHKRNRFLILFSIFASLCFILTFLYLEFNFSMRNALLWFLPLALAVILTIYYVIWVTSFVMTRIIDVGNVKFNVIFSLTSFELLVVFVFFLMNEEVPLIFSSFLLCFCVILICYLLTCAAMKTVLRETAQLKTTCFTYRNLWKVALTLFLEFIVELAFFCYLGSIYFPNAYSVPVTLFDLFYYVVITFGTVGYGDIIPQCTYTKLIAMLTTITSIACIGIMLGSFMSVSHHHDDH